MTPTSAELEQLAQSPEGRRQIDVLAGKLFGFTPTIVYGAAHEGDNGWYVMTSRHGPFRHKSDIEKWIAENPVVCGKPVVLDSVEDWPEFTTSIADAWQLVDALWAKHEWRLWPEPSWQGQWSGLCYHKGTFIAQSGWFEDAPLAITLAAILAGGEKEKA